MSNVAIFENTTGSLTSSYTKHTIALTGKAAQTKKVFLQSLDLSWDNESAGVATIDWYLTHDSTGDVVSVRNKQSTVVDGQTADAAGVAETLEVWLKTDGNLYVWIKTDSPTADVVQLRATCEV